jgi:hypothetical protein
MEMFHSGNNAVLLLRATYYNNFELVEFDKISHNFMVC